jgi:hypothetical protein
VGFTKKVIGFPRVAKLLCATARRTAVNATPIVIAAAGSDDERRRLLPLLRRLREGSASRPTTLWESDVTELWLDKAIYRFLIIPITKKRLLGASSSSRGCTTPRFPNGGGARRRDEPDQVLHAEVADGRQLARLTCRRSGT